jgi:hypothetical protein
MYETLFFNCFLLMAVMEFLSYFVLVLSSFQVSLRFTNLLQLHVDAASGAGAAY